MTKEEIVAKTIVDNEYATAKSNQSANWIDFESVLDMFEMKRTEKNYEWLSDVFLPELPSMILTDASNWANQYFQSRDFVDVYLEGDEPENKANSRAVKKLINKTLNNKELCYYQKYMRMRLINAMAGYVYLKCWWEFAEEDVVSGYEDRALDVDIEGNPMMDGSPQEAATEQVPVYTKKILKDRFNFDVIDPRNVYTDNKYVYSIQEKDWIIVRSEMSYDEIAASAKSNGYINVKKLLELKAETETETSKETYNKDEEQEKVDTPTSIKYFDVLERFGKFWCVVKKRNDSGVPVKVEIGLDEAGKPLPKAELLEMIITVAVCGNTKQLIRFQASPFLDKDNKPFRPLIRGLCYIHPTKDTGLSSGKYLKESQIAINDTFNMSQDRVKLATLPTLKGRRYSIEDNSTVYIEPEHVIMLDDPKNDLEELKFSDDIGGALNQIGMLQSGMQKVEAIFPTTMGELPGKASTTATAISGSEQRGNARSNYKSLTFEYTCLIELYNMLITMTNRFMKPETALKIMGEDAYSFDPRSDYSFVPVSSNIEMEHNKYQKIKMIDQLIGRLVNVPNPKTPMLINKLVSMAFEYLGQEYQDFSKLLLDENVPPPMEEGQGNGGQVSNMPDQPMSNQNGVPQSGGEEMAREMSGGM